MKPCLLMTSVARLQGERQLGGGEDIVGHGTQRGHHREAPGR
jgi:hypothetical protein